jgi:two-component system, sensor histidine kinase and response regulator
VTHSRNSTPDEADWPGQQRVDPVLAAITHELRVPLQAIIGFTQLAKMDWPTGVDQRYILNIDQASRLMLRVVNDLLDLSHLEQGTLEIEPDQPLDLTSLLVRVKVAADSLRQDKPVRVYLKMDDAMPVGLRGDAKRIEQILLNLVANAIRFTDRGHVMVGARVFSVSEAEICVRLYISDSGIGMPAAELERLKQPLGATVSKPAPRRGGSGLGLSIVRRLLELHGTELHASSVPSGGTLIWFDLVLDKHVNESMVSPNHPMADAVFTQDDRFFHTVKVLWASQGSRVMRMQTAGDAAPSCRWVIDSALPNAAALVGTAQLQQSHGYTVTAGPATPEQKNLVQLFMDLFGHEQRKDIQVDPMLGGCRMLVVEDNKLNQQVLKEQITRLGMFCETASTGLEAQSLLLQTTWDGVIIDMQLPDTSGLAIAKWIKAQPSLVQLPFIFLSAHLSASDRLAAQALGAQGCLLKPHDPQALHKLLLLLRKNSVRSLAGPQRAQAGLQALSSIDLKHLFASEWPSLRMAIQQADEPISLRKAVHAVRGSLAVLGDNEALQKARALEEQLLAENTMNREKLRDFLGAIEQLVKNLDSVPGH